MTEIIIENFIKNHKWTTAKSMPHIPHEYVCKDYLDDVDKKIFEQIAQYIRDYGVCAKFFKREYIYLQVGDYFYWTMGNPIPETTILNRASTEKYRIKQLRDYKMMEIIR